MLQCANEYPASLQGCEIFTQTSNSGTQDHFYTINASLDHVKSYLAVVVANLIYIHKILK